MNPRDSLDSADKNFFFRILTQDLSVVYPVANHQSDRSIPDLNLQKVRTL